MCCRRASLDFGSRWTTNDCRGVWPAKPGHQLGRIGMRREILDLLDRRAHDDVLPVEPDVALARGQCGSPFRPPGSPTAGSCCAGSCPYAARWCMRPPVAMPLPARMILGLRSRFSQTDCSMLCTGVARPHASAHAARSICSSSGCSEKIVVASIAIGLLR